jgi:hypothetical protein
MTHVSGTFHPPSLDMLAGSAALLVTGVVVGVAVAGFAIGIPTSSSPVEAQRARAAAAGVAENNMTDAVRAAQLAVEAQRARAAAAGVAENNMTDAVRAAQLAVEAEDSTAVEPNLLNGE